MTCKIKLTLKIVKEKLKKQKGTRRNLPRLLTLKSIRKVGFFNIRQFGFVVPFAPKIDRWSGF